MAFSQRRVPVAYRSSFDPPLDRLGDSLISLSELELLKESHWDLGQDARLREDLRFRETPWGRWIRAEDLLANEALYRELHGGRNGRTDLRTALATLAQHFGRRCVLCKGDPRLIVSGAEVRLAASELSSLPAIEDDVGDLEKYTTHLPIHSLKAAAASDPAGDWEASETLVEPLGWIRVDVPGRRLSRDMFVAQVEGESMDDGRTGLKNGAYVVFDWWPHGSRRNQDVLIRGRFSSPETPGWAFKTYVADDRDEEGRHRAIRLVSRNPDKERFPDIVLEPENDDDFQIVASRVHVLQPDDYARRPKPLPHKGRRDLENEDALRQVHQQLSERAARFFETAATPITILHEQPNTAAWNSQLVCLDIDAGGPHLEIGPLFGLWTFVKRLVLQGVTGESRRTLASNARLRPVHLPVLPSEGAWTWRADGFEDDPDVDLSALDVAGLPHDRVTVFHVGVDGVGHLQSAHPLSPGQGYRLLIPPEFGEATNHPIATSPLADGWRLAEVALSDAPDSKLVQALDRLGLSLGNPAPRLSFGLPCWADEWRSTARGEAFAVFVASADGLASVLITADGFDAEVDGEAQLFVHGPDGARRVALPAGTSVTIELASLPVGRYFATLLHQRTRIQPAHLPFEVSTDLSAPPQAAWSAIVAETTHTGTANTEVPLWRGDLALLQQDGLIIEGPPGWGVRVLWREVANDYLATLELDPSGQLDIHRLFSLTRERRERRLLGDLVLDLAELGALVLEHERHASAPDVAERLSELVRMKGDVVRRRNGAYAQLLPMWFEPVGQALGYEVDPITELPEPPPLHAAAARLLVTERRAAGIGRRQKRVLVMLEQLESALEEALLDWIDALCLHLEVDSALLSTGLAWAEHRRRSRLPLKVWDLETVLGQEERLIAFLRDVAEGV